ncbi:MAG: NUDIX hydrolase [Cyanobacteriota bacterium]
MEYQKYQKQNMNKSNLLSLISDYIKKYPLDSNAIKTLAFLEENEYFWQKENILGHVTASALVINQSVTKSLLTHHLKLDKWLQLGGHVEHSDNDIFDSCIREVKEESGLELISFYSKEIFDIDVHLIPNLKNASLSHFHYDIRFLIVASDKEQINFDFNESNIVKWFNFAEIVNLSLDESIYRMIEKTKKILS